jgi:hypothetical protein
MLIICRFGLKSHVDTVAYVARHMTPGSVVYLTLGYNYSLPSGDILLFQVEPNAAISSYNLVGLWGTLGSPSNVSILRLACNDEALVRFSHYQAGKQ